MPRRSMGRQKVDMVKMQNESNLQVTFSKRRAGLFKKASELSMLCGAEIVVVVFSPGKKVYSFGHPCVASMVDRFLGRNIPPPPNNDSHNQLIMAHRNAGLRELNMELTNTEGVLQIEKDRGESLLETRRRANNHWWEAPTEELNFFQLQHLKEALESLKEKAQKEAQQKQMVNNIAFPFHTFGSALAPSNGARATSSFQNRVSTGVNIGAPFANRVSTGSTSFVVSK